MKKNNMKKSVIATILATSLLAPTNVGFANNSLQEIVDQARRDMKEATYSYTVPSQNGKVATSNSLYPVLNTAKENYKKAKAAIMKSDAKNKDTLLKDLDDLYNERITKGIIPYIDAYNYADKYLNPIMSDIKKAEEAKDWEKVETLYHKLSVQLKNRTAILYRFSGKAARDLLLEQYKEPANLKRDQLIVPVTIYMKVKEAETLLAAGKKEEAIKVLESIKSLISQLPSTSSLPMVKELLDKVSDVAKEAGVDLTTPTTPPSTGGGNSGGSNGGGNADSTFKLSIMHTNDTHAHLDNVAKRVTAVKEVRKEKPSALLIDAGDVFSGTLYFNEFKGQADVRFMNLMKYDAMTFGNHEFDLGSSPEGHKALADFIKAANFPFVSANVDFAQDELFTGLFNTKISTGPKKGNIYSGIVKVVNGEKVGIFGLTTEETKDISSPGKVTFSNYIEDAKIMVAEFEKMGVNKIVAISHIGYDDNPAVDNDIELAKAVKGIDVIVGGHSHTTLSKPILIDTNAEPTIIVQTGQYGDNLGSLDVTFDKKGVLVAHKGELINVSTKKEDPEAAEILKGYSDEIDKIAKKEIGATAKNTLENPRKNSNSVRKNETPLGNLITDGMLKKAKEYDEAVVMAFQNGGGIRSHIDQGAITVKEVIEVLPFGNTLATMKLTGAEIKAAFEISFKELPRENGGFLHVSGAKVEFNSSKPVGQRVVSIKYNNGENNYTEIKDDDTYTVATNAFTAKGGDSYTVFAKAYAEGRVTDLGLSDWENLRDHLVDLKEVDPKIEGRIVNVSENFDLSLMHFNDTHAHLENAAKRVTAVNEVRAAKPNALLLDAGDVFSGTLYFNEFKGLADLEFMNLMKVDAMTFGNHEFDLGSSPEGHKALADFIKAANFPFVSSNVDFSKDDLFTGLFNTKISETPVKGNIYSGIVKVVNGEKVGIFGLTTAETKDISSPGSITFSDYIKDAKKMVAEFEKMGVNKVIAITHIGYDDNPAIDNDIELAKAVQGIDVIVGGHSHTTLAAPVLIGVNDEPTIIVQTGQYADNLGTLDVTFDANGVVVSHAGKLIKVADKVADPDAALILKKYSDRIAEISNEETGAIAVNALDIPRTNGDDTKPSVRKNETPLGNLITDGMLRKAKVYNKNVIMAFQNGGGIRAGINQGPITVGEIITVLPFGNTLATMDLTGAEIKATFEISLKELPRENGGFLHVSGAKVLFDSSKPVGERVVSISYKNENNTYTKIQDNETYTIATNAFTAKGGDGYTVLKNAYEQGRVTDLGLSDWENLREEIVRLGNVDPKVEGRIVDVSKVEGEIPGGNIPAIDFSGTPQAPKVYNGNVTVSVSGVSFLGNVIIKGNLTLTGTPSDNISLSDITVQGNLDLSGLDGDIYNLDGINVIGETIL